ncbi:efflux RND transporter periplasmic adaptor subunit [Zunongwangia pacifica]|uniref:Efflux RND transporter periplasmic adaptor subunit n=1 Tax=Zunongwangia pacifica TaxID=2911062 RepID=A0A9X1ZUH2_9FLAO|nr:efflux RND transporter periplasmic adaptor subunit [Zunongwangia pacifica]MCL6220341.1 efflux RND transporter periplasmic adaptor subunit [Zunongwangia pacifica]
MRKFHFILLFCLATLTLQSCKKEEKEREIQPIEVKTVMVGNTSLESSGAHFSATGRIAADKSVKLSFQVSGTIEQFPVSMGDFVQKGSLIAKIDGTAYQKQYEARRAQAEMAKDNYNRVEEVYKKGSIAEVKMVEARSNYKQAEAAAQASYQNVKFTRITAPFTGYIGEKMMETGDLASPGQPIVDFFDINKLKAIIPIPDDQVNQYQTGDKAIVKIEVLDTEYEGEITEISVQSDSNTPSYTAKITINNDDKKIKPGMACTVTLPEKENTSEETSNTFIVPVETVSVTEKNENFVYVVNENKAERRIVKTGKLYNNGITITEGLQKGDQLITSGYHKLTQDTPVTIINKQ